MTAATDRQAHTALVIAHRQQTARLYKVEQLVRGFVAQFCYWACVERDGRCHPHDQPLPCPHAMLLERARDLGLVE